MDALFILLLLIAFGVTVLAIRKATKKASAGSRPGKPSVGARPREES